MSLITSYVNFKHNEDLLTNSLAIKVRFRPGYLGRWLEIHNILSDDKSVASKNIESKVEMNLNS